MSSNEYATFCKGDPFSIKMVGSRDFVLERVLTLEEDFNEPKFGYNGELWDEEDGYRSEEE
jgi:hypothetical protein